MGSKPHGISGSHAAAALGISKYVPLLSILQYGGIVYAK
ncbi:MAG: YqaJ viral recombinase family protein [Tannerellaceae bacterium]|jgi:hypothetical protein|nr:YqaJ viral recombinase family protein [Tannerellaceae bacterium]